MFSGMASYSESSSDDDEDDMAWELARAILKFGEIHGRIENSEQRRRIELEKQRMEFTKEVEFERLNMFVDAQLELTKKSFKRDKSTSSSG
ncbi:hypothetical protein POTOM_038543 [Populus tomentosa]|uniref:Uncharacterized protein n=1 Tax=Populus tomentosa TaxID=118781 RepID=A0A8X7YXJ5_POPTO|nr:hypothetical protein POTOM_038543 [Populus tomentosa]